MATAFSDSEKEIIRIKLNDIAQECLAKHGVRKTTVDQIVQMAGIAKGSFYNFYSRKEILFFITDHPVVFIQQETLKIIPREKPVERIQLIFHVEAHRRGDTVTFQQINQFPFVFRMKEEQHGNPA